MRKITLIMMVAIMLIGTSCRKKSSSCDCGEIVDIFKMKLDGNDIGIPIVLKGGKTITVKNFCSRNEKDFKDKEIEYDWDVVGDKWCDPKGKEW